MNQRGIGFYFKKNSSQDVNINIENPGGGDTNINLEDSDNGGDDINGAENRLEFQMNVDSPPTKIRKINEDVGDKDVERDPGKRMMIWDYPVDKRDEVRRSYLRHGPYQPVAPIPKENFDKKGRKFLCSWYKLFPVWLEYSPTANAAFCLQCFLFSKKSVVFGSNTFITGGFKAWKKVNDGENCAFLTHEGKGPNSTHKIAMKSSFDLMNSLQHIDRIVDKQTSEMIAKNRLRIKVSADVVKLCAFQAIAFRGHNERVDSPNRGNFLELVKHTASYNKEVAEVVLENAPKNASYTSPPIQKELLALYARRIRKSIREEIGDRKFCIIVDESRDESKREQMAIVLRFVDKDGIVRERFLDIVHVEDTKALTLKKKICDILSHHNLDIQNIRGQGYDGASNMRGEWKGLQALFLNECPYAYYIHCFAHRLQLILVATFQCSVIPVGNFISHLTTIINVVASSPKRHDHLQIAQAIHIEELISEGELETGTGKNQVGTIQRPCDTRWSSHLRSLHNLLKMFDSTLLVLKDIMDDPLDGPSRSTADGAYDVMLSFEFVFVLHFLLELLGRTDNLCRMLQCKSQDIINAMDAVSNTKDIIQNFRENGWDTLLEKVENFCEKRNIEIPDMNGPRLSSKGRFLKGNPITSGHHYRVEIFYGTIDCLLQEMAFRFKEDSVELLKLSAAFDPRDDYKLFDKDKICKLVEKFYPVDFTSQERLRLGNQLELFEVDIRKNTHFRNVKTISELCFVLSKSGKASHYYLVDEVIGCEIKWKTDFYPAR